MSRISRKYNLPWSTNNLWENELRQKNKKVTLHKRSAHLQSGSGGELSYPKEVEEKLVEWILVRGDCHLPVGTQMVKGRAATLIKGHNPSFKTSNAWLDKFMLWKSLSMRMKTSTSQKLPAQLEKRIESFFIRVRALRAEHQYPLDLIININETPLFFDMSHNIQSAKKVSSKCQFGHQEQKKD
uniref:HTH CENPB-type domain-containing protein n=1 Tax=Amphimedon queenslandica TaxID=400682 RepID=A0A1X7V4S4_AMPQE